MAVPSSGNAISFLGLAKEKMEDNYSSNFIPPNTARNVFPYPNDWYTWNTEENNYILSRGTSADGSPVGDTPIKMIVTGTNPYTPTYGSGADVLSYLPDANETWTFSCYAKSSSAQTCQLWIFFTTILGALVSGNYSHDTISVTTSWQRFEYTQVATSDASIETIQIRIVGGASGTTQYWDGFQVEQTGEVSDVVAYGMISASLYEGGYSMRDLAVGGTSGGSGMSIESTNTSSPSYPNTSTPHSVSEWYDYDHDYTVTSWNANDTVNIVGTMPGAGSTSYVYSNLGTFVLSGTPTGNIVIVATQNNNTNCRVAWSVVGDPGTGNGTGNSGTGWQNGGSTLSHTPNSTTVYYRLRIRMNGRFGFDDTDIWTLTQNSVSATLTCNYDIEDEGEFL